MTMSGGRSPSEAKGAAGGRKMTEKTMFKELRHKLNTAAEDPAFFDTAAGKVVRTLFLSGGIVVSRPDVRDCALRLGLSTDHSYAAVVAFVDNDDYWGFSLSLSL